jgi:caspase domain-containing protein
MPVATKSAHKMIDGMRNAASVREPTHVARECVSLIIRSRSMRQRLFVFVALLLCANAIAGVKKILPGGRRPMRDIDPHASAALFVGVRTFTEDDNLTEVKYAVDDAVDLAYEVAMDRQPLLVAPERVVLAISGEPQKPQSQERLKKLLDAGAVQARADVPEILKLLKSQSRAAEQGGIFIVSFATHGMSDDGMQHLLAANSLLEYRETDVTEARVLDIVSTSGVERSLILIDACRERIRRDQRNGTTDPKSVAAFLSAMAVVDGQVILSAASPGDYAYDDDERGNGVFTAAVIDGLHCGAPTDGRGYVTVGTLGDYVEGRVLNWIRAHRDHEARKATQMNWEGRSKDMPLSICGATHIASSSPPRPR